MFLGDKDIPRDLMLKLIEEFGDQTWTLRNPYDNYYSWQLFSEHIKCHKRFFFHEDLRFVDEPTMHGSPIELIK